MHSYANFVMARQKFCDSETYTGEGQKPQNATVNPNDYNRVPFKGALKGLL